MHTSRILAVAIIALFIPRVAIPQTKSVSTLPGPVKTELNRLDEAYTILDQFSEKVWTGWTDFMDFPFMMKFQNGLRVLTGHPNPPEGFVLYPGITVHGLSVYIDTTNLNDFKIKMPVSVGGGVLTYGTNHDQPVTIVDLNVTNDGDTLIPGSAENHILIFIHELMHCHQQKIMPESYGNLDLNPDLNFALYSEIEGLALTKAYQQDSKDKALPFLVDFCIARSLKFKGLDNDELNSARCDEFREGEAVYSEVRILQSLKDGFNNNLTTEQDPEYTQFKNTDPLLDKYFKRLAENAPKTLELYQKNYDYGCFQALLLQHYFPGWQKDVESGSWLDLILRKYLDIKESDSLQSLRRFDDIYQISSLREKHSKIINGRNDTYRMFQAREGQTYVISFKPIQHYAAGDVDKTRTNYKLGLIEMFPEGIGAIRFDGVSLDSKPLPVEINELYYIKVIDTDPKKSGKPYSMDYQSKDENEIYHNVTVTTPVFILKAPKVMIRERAGRVKFIIMSRT